MIFELRESWGSGSPSLTATYAFSLAPRAQHTHTSSCPKFEAQETAASPAIFQRVMDRWFSEYLWKSVIIWIDDILIYSKTFEDHMVAFLKVFLVLRKNGLMASKRKLKTCMRSVRYLGFIFGVQGVRADPDKLAAVYNIPTPRTRKEVRQFLGFANFYRRFLPPNFSSVGGDTAHGPHQREE